MINFNNNVFTRFLDKRTLKHSDTTSDNKFLKPKSKHILYQRKKNVKYSDDCNFIGIPKCHNLVKAAKMLGLEDSRSKIMNFAFTAWFNKNPNNILKQLLTNENQLWAESLMDYVEKEYSKYFLNLLFTLQGTRATLRIYTKRYLKNMRRREGSSKGSNSSFPIGKRFLKVSTLSPLHRQAVL